MKNNFLILLISLISFAIFSCKKTDSDTGIAVNALVPAITTTDATNVTGSGATVGGDITSDGGSIVTESGICYGGDANPTIESRKIVLHKISGPFSTNLTGLVPDSTYHYRAYAINNKGISYGEDKSFTVPFVLPAGRLAYYDMNGSSDNTIDNTTGTNTAITWTDGVNGQAAQFNGTTSFISYATVNGFENVSSGFSISFWFNTTAAITGPIISLNKDGFSWESTKLIFESEGNSTATLMNAKLNALDVSWSEFVGGNGFANVFDGQWHQIALTYDGLKVTSYLDGAAHYTVNTTMPLPFGDFDSFTIGSGGWFGTTTVSACKIDQVGLYNVVLNGSQIAGLYSHHL